MELKKLLTGMIASAVVASSVYAQEAAPAPAAAPAAAPEAAVAAEETNEWMPSFDLNLKYATRYLSKGRVVNPEDMLFIDASIALKGFYLGIWVADDLNGYNKDCGIQDEPEEIDYYFGYGYTFEEVPVINSLSVDLCVSYWDYPKRSGWQCVGEQQWEYALSLNAGVFLNPGVKICWDPENELWYGNLNAGWDCSLKDLGMEMATFKTGCEFWWGNDRVLGNWSNSDVSNDLTFGMLVWNAAVDFALTDNITLTPFMQFGVALDKSVRDCWKEHGNANSASGINNQFGVKLDFAF